MENSDEKLTAGAKKKHSEVEAACRVAVSIRSTPEGARVAVDGTVRGKTPFDTKLLPGQYAIVVDLSGYERATETLVVERSKPREMELTLTEKKIEVAPPPPPIEIVTPTPVEETGPNAFTWVAFGVGGAGLIAGAAFTGLAVRDLDREEQARLTPLPKAEIEAIQRQAKRDAIIAHVGYSVAVAGAATGLILFFVTGGEPKEVAVAPSIGAGSIGLAGSF
jgi:hypothetical protein